VKICEEKDMGRRRLSLEKIRVRCYIGDQYVGEFETYDRATILFQARERYGSQVKVWYI
jgi:hypothetical protein